LTVIRLRLRSSSSSSSSDSRQKLEEFDHCFKDFPDGSGMTRRRVVLLQQNWIHF
jgi:hypothetical protein